MSHSKSLLLLLSLLLSPLPLTTATITTSSLPVSHSCMSPSYWMTVTFKYKHLHANVYLITMYTVVNVYLHFSFSLQNLEKNTGMEMKNCSHRSLINHFVQLYSLRFKNFLTYFLQHSLVFFLFLWCKANNRSLSVMKIKN